MEFITRPEYVADYSINTGYIANRASAYETEAMQAYVAEAPQALATRDALQYAGAELATQNLGQVRGIFHDYLQRAINGEMGAAEAMAAACFGQLVTCYTSSNAGNLRILTTERPGKRSSVRQSG